MSRYQTQQLELLAVELARDAQRLITATAIVSRGGEVEAAYARVRAYQHLQEARARIERMEDALELDARAAIDRATGGEAA